MSSTSEIVPRSSVGGDRAAVRPGDYWSVAGRWFLFTDYGLVAQRRMAVVWSCVLACALADFVWLPQSKLSFIPSNWSPLARGVACLALAGALVAVAFNRLRNDDGWIAALLRRGLTRTELLCRMALSFGALLTAGATLSYVITAADLPLRDSLLAQADQSLGFDWLHFLEVTNSTPYVATWLARVYNTAGPVTELVILWLALTRNGERIAELLAILGLSTVGLCVGMLVIPAAGAFAYYEPAPQIFANYSALGEMWTFGHTFNMLRDGSLSVVDLSALDGVVSFPSFHTMLGVIGIYAARGTRWLFVFVFLTNASMIVSTMPVGGHHLSDVLAGAGLTLAAIFVVRRQKANLPAPS